MSTGDESKTIHRVKNSKKRGKIYANTDNFIDLAKLAISDNDSKTTEDSFNKILKYFDNTKISYREFLQFGKDFPYNDYLNFILKNNNENENFLAFQILSRTIAFEEAECEFLCRPELIEICNSLINDPNYSEYVFSILIGGSIYTEFGKIFLDMGICDFLIECQPSQDIAMLVCNLTLFESDYLRKLLEIIYKILNSNKIEYSTFCYAIKSIHHILDRWDDIDPSVLEVIDEKITPVFYAIASECFKTKENRILNSILRYLYHLSDVPVEFGQLILASIANINNVEKSQNAKTFKLAAKVFQKNVETWLPELQEIFLEIMLTKCQFVPYDIKGHVFSAVLLYYNCSFGVIDQFMPTIIEWCLEFVGDQKYTTRALQQLYDIAAAAKEDEDIMSTISSSVPFFEELMFSGKADDEALEIAENLIAIFDTD